MRTSVAMSNNYPAESVTRSLTE